MWLNMVSTRSGCVSCKELFKHVFKHGFKTHLACATLTELFKHVLKKGFKHIGDVCHAGNSLNMCLTMGLNTFGMCVMQRTV